MIIFGILDIAKLAGGRLLGSSSYIVTSVYSLGETFP